MANSRHSATIFSPSSKRPTKRTRSSITEHSFQGITPSPKGKKCHPCVRYKVSPMCQAAHSLHGKTPSLRMRKDSCRGKPILLACGISSNSERNRYSKVCAPTTDSQICCDTWVGEAELD